MVFQSICPWRCSWLILLLLVNFSKGSVNATRHEKLLFEHLFRDYNKEIRPVIDQSEAVQVEFGFALSEILDLDEKNQVLTTNVWIRQRWDDLTLAWNSSLHGNIKSININPEIVWKPDIVLYNNVNDENHGEQYLFQTKVIISSDGTISWFSPNKLKSFCKIDIKFFPFDTQQCRMTFGSWTFNGLKLDLVFFQNSSRAGLGKYSKNGEWELVSAEGQRNTIVYQCCPEPYIDLSYNIKMKRRSLFYLNNLILPCIVLALLTSVSFMFPPETGERISLVITVLLGMTVFMIVFTEAIPSTSEVTPLIGKYFAAVLFEVSLCLLATCVPLRLQHLHAGTEMPKWFKVLIFDIVGPVMCFGRKRKTNTVNSLTMQKPLQHTNGDVKLNHMEVNENGYADDSRRQSDANRERPRSRNAPAPANNDGILEITKYVDKMERDAELYAEWKNAIGILDRLFFWLFIATFAITSVVILMGNSLSA